MYVDQCVFLPRSCAAGCAARACQSTTLAPSAAALAASTGELTMRPTRLAPPCSSRLATPIGRPRSMTSSFSDRQRRLPCAAFMTVENTLSMLILLLCVWGEEQATWRCTALQGEWG